MTNAQNVAETYIAFWNAADADERRRLYEDAFAPGARYADPIMRGEGAEEIGGLAQGAQQRFPGFRFQLIGRADGHGDFVRFRWALGPQGAQAPIEGSDVVRLEGGRIVEVIGFLDKVPG
jgi:hypothetical protein